MLLHLLTIKADQDYIRRTDQGYELCALDKASVWPKAKLELVKRELERVKKSFPKAQIHTLSITEEPFCEPGGGR